MKLLICIFVSTSLMACQEISRKKSPNFSKGNQNLDAEMNAPIEDIDSSDTDDTNDTNTDSFNLQSLPSVLPFYVRINKLAHILDISPSEAESSPLFAKLISNRYLLGDYDFSQRIIEQINWKESQIGIWAKSIEPICSSPLFKSLYTLDKMPDELYKKAIGRLPNDSEKEIFLGLDDENLTDDEKLSLSCIAILSSLEFQTQYSSLDSSLIAYYNKIAANLIQRPLEESEVLKLKDSPKTAGKNLLESWTKSNEFIIAFKHYISKLLFVSGQTKELDFDTPAYLAEHIQKANLPYHRLITSSKCVDKAGTEVSCDSNAPFGAGLLTTRAFLKSKSGAFNLARANKLLENFLCSTYPLPEEMEPKLKKEDLIDGFAQEDGMGFGNGSNCYVCHSQFGKHAQLFVNFNNEGLYDATATGLQNPDQNVADGYSENGLFTSHLRNPAKAKNESSSYLGKPAANLGEAAKIIAKDPLFVKCAINKAISFSLDVEINEKHFIDPEIIDAIYQDIISKEPEPDFGLIISETLGNDRIVNGFKNSLIVKEPAVK